MAAFREPLPAPYQFEPTTRLLRTGGRDPSVRREPDGFWRTTWTQEGAATVHLRVVGDELRAEAWGDGAERALADVPHWVGLNEPAWELPSHPVTDRLLRDYPGVRLTDTRDPCAAMTTTVLQQLVTWNEAAANWRRLCVPFRSTTVSTTPKRTRRSPSNLR